MTINYLELEETYALGVYAKKELVLVKGRNARIWDKDGNEYIDCVSGNGVANLGHANEKIAQAVSEQAARLITCSNMFYNDQRALLLEKLIQITPANLNKTFLCSSGTESIEGAIKFAKVTTQKTEFVCAEKAFHGRTTGSLSATFKPEYKKGFEPLLPGFGFVPFNDFDSLKELVNQNTAGIILEVIQGEGGINIGNADVTLEQNLFVNNQSEFCVVDLGTQSNIRVINNTFDSNRGAMGSSSAGAVFMNNIVTNTTGPAVNGVFATLDYNDFWNNATDYIGVAPGINDIHLDPLFVSPTAGDYSLQPLSPCIDAGGLSADCRASDLDGNPRFLNDPDTPDTGLGGPLVIDMGAYEFSSDDCNDNGTPDADEILAEPLLDDNGNGILDECEPSLADCNLNGLPDYCEILGGSSVDCNANGIPD
ncbi:aminotransferase class III-fold pyridoxal phosphate-dependent enzyme, partial [candidate division KSB1 bacterium]|nr:aminotransferase class III-fold pyridoxal phosphate-dependent enzyme [candidate division KSB1 bacterium]